MVYYPRISCPDPQSPATPKPKKKGPPSTRKPKYKTRPKQSPFLPSSKIPPISSDPSDPDSGLIIPVWNPSARDFGEEWSKMYPKSLAIQLVKCGVVLDEHVMNSLTVLATRMFKSKPTPCLCSSLDSILATLVEGASVQQRHQDQGEAVTVAQNLKSTVAILREEIKAVKDHNHSLESMVTSAQMGIKSHLKQLEEVYPKFEKVTTIPPHLPRDCLGDSPAKSRIIREHAAGNLDPFIAGSAKRKADGPENKANPKVKCAPPL